MSEFEPIPEWIEELQQTLEYRIEEAKLAFVHEVWMLMGDKPVSRAELARRLGCSRAWVTQLLDKNANPTLETMLKIAEALDADLKVKLKERTPNEDSSSAESTKSTPPIAAKA